MASDPSDGCFDQLTLQEAQFIAAVRRVPQEDRPRLHAALMEYFRDGGDFAQVLRGHGFAL